MNVEIPDKLFFKIGEVASITGVKPHVLRYWESEFGSFTPAKSRTKQRQYQKKDIELVLILKDLLYSQGLPSLALVRQSVHQKNILKLKIHPQMTENCY